MRQDTETDKTHKKGGSLSSHLPLLSYKYS